MELDGYLLLVEYVVQVEQIVQSHEMDWVHKALLIQESLEFEVVVVSRT